MIEISQRLDHTPTTIDDTIVLTYDQRVKARLKTQSTSGEEARIFLERGRSMQLGEVLKSTDGRYIQVAGAVEDVVYAEISDWQVFAKVCYHLGNRHLTVEVGEKYLCFKPDHVIEELVQSFGMKTGIQQRIFHPESGAYHKGGHGHHHHD